MNILVGISHPKQVHIFKNLISELEKRGHSYCVLVNEKEITSELLDSFNISYKKIGSNQKGIIQKLLQLPLLTIKTFLISLKFKPDIFIGQAIPHLAYTSYIIRKPFIVFEDTESSSLLQKIVNPFANSIVTPTSFRKDLGKKQISIRGGFELAYLGPKCFSPDPDVLRQLGLSEGEKFVILRFVSWNANHDIGHKGISDSNKIKVVNIFKKYAKVFISSEGPLPEELESYKFECSPVRMHHAIYYSSLVFGESATMAAEAAYLGTPSIYLDDVGRGHQDILEDKYDLVFNFGESEEEQQKSIRKALEILKSVDKSSIEAKRKRLVAESIDVNTFMLWFIEHYPESHGMMKENPEYQDRFK
ncbi:MAG: DUF354 domain-containing protein [Bacteroidetes bacterium]|nr:DUF354 domain-containing protein [Bacteroidota bacterium]